MRALLSSVLGALLLTPTLLVAQAPAWPDGWKVRTDRENVDRSSITFEVMEPGFRVVSGPAAIYWRDEQRAAGRYRVELETHLFDPEGRREAFGFFFGGRQLEGAGQRYTYFLIREGGEFLLKERDGRETSTLVGWTGHPAIVSFAEAADGVGSVKNVLALEADDSELRFFVNGAQVTAIPRSAGRAEGIVGFRVNHQLNLHISRLAVSPLRR
jgi:hypothetical protein